MPNMDIIGSVKSSLTEPKKYLATLVNRKSLTEAYILYLILSAITTIIYIPYLYLDYSQKFSEQSTVLAWVIGMTLFMVVYSLGGIFITIGIHHLFLKLFGAKGRFVDTFNSNIYSFITSFLFSIIYIIIFFFMKLAVPDIKTGALSSIILYFNISSEVIYHSDFCIFSYSASVILLCVKTYSLIFSSYFSLNDQ